MHFQIYNTLSRTKEKFSPIHERKVHYYSCGPTVYNTVHIGNLRAFLAADTLYRWLKHGQNYEVRWVMNITDVDDKTIRDSKAKYPDLEPMEALIKFTRFYEDAFFEDLQRLHIEKESFYQTPRATESVEAMQDLTRKILENGIGYEKDGSIYFSVERFIEKEKYGKLIPLDLESLKTGTRTLADEIEKENVQDFVLWKAQKEGEPSWDFIIDGNNYPGRPGWHIECSAMGKEAFGTFPFDIHSGGVDLKFPHHEDEIAQSVAGYGEEPVKYWFHNEHLMVEGAKMSKSLGNFYTLQDLLEQGHSADTIRYFLVTNHYRTKINLTQDALSGAKNALERIRNYCRELKKKENTSGNESISEQKRKFEVAMNDDLNTPNATAALFEAFSVQNTDATEMTEFVEFVEKVFGIPFFQKQKEIPENIITLAEKRKTARESKDWEESDRLRDEIANYGYIIRDEGDEYELIKQES